MSSNMVHLQTIKVVFNPNAGNLRGLTQETIAACIQEQNLLYEWVTVQDLKRFAQHDTQHHFILIIGGDGTIHATLNAIGYHHLHRFTFGIIPTGTGNDLARSLKIPLNIRDAFHLLSQGRIHTVDLGVLNHRICFCCAVSIGFGPEVTKKASRFLKLILGRGAFCVGALFYLLRPKPLYELKIRMNDQQEYFLKTPHLVVGNAKFHGGGHAITPTADLKNECLDLYYVKPLGFWNSPKLLLNAFMRQDHTVLAEVTSHQLKNIQIRLRRPTDVDVDGDIYTFYKTIHMTVLPAKLPILAPDEIVLQNKPVQHPAWNFMGRKRCAS